jgi:hypothetical protein
LVKAARVCVPVTLRRGLRSGRAGALHASTLPGTRMDPTPGVFHLPELPEPNKDIAVYAIAVITVLLSLCTTTYSFMNIT